MFTGELTDKPCFLCGRQEDTLEVKMKDKTFAGVICITDLMKLLKRKPQPSPEKAK